MSRLRSPAVAGMFYPDNAVVLRDTIQQYLQQATVQTTACPRVLVVPHAGYVYSGEVAAVAYRQIAACAHDIHKVVLMGPSHRVAFHGLALPRSEGFQTPLGTVKLDMVLYEKVQALPGVVVSEQAHAAEHSLEVQLPFLQQILPDFSLLPLVIGDASMEEVAAVIAAIWHEPDTLFVISTDLSHYHAYSQAQQLDRATSEAIVQLQPEQIGYENACGRNGLNGMLLFAREQGLQAECLDLRNSGDTAGDKNRVVGYGAYVIH